MDELERMWKEQADFNALFRNEAKTMDTQIDQSKDFALGMVDQIGSLIKEIQWQPHRVLDGRMMNPANVKNQLSDMLKYWMSLCLVWGVDPEDAVEDFWRKSMVCRQRHSQEFVLEMNSRIALVDIDGVLCDWQKGWDLYTKNSSQLRTYVERKHAFRSCGAKQYLEVFPDAKAFLQWLAEEHITVVLYTARPIERYPNLLGDTLVWLKKHDLYFDAIWWATRKAIDEKIRAIYDQIEFAVDDDFHHCMEYEAMGIPAYHLCRASDHSGSGLKTISSLEEIGIDVR